MNTNMQTSKAGFISGTWLLMAAGGLFVVGMALTHKGQALETRATQPDASLARHAGAWDVAAPSLAQAAASATTTYELLDPVEVLSSFYGERWPAVEAELFPDGIEGATLPPICAWEDAGPVLVEALAPDSPNRVDIGYRNLVRWPGWSYSDDPKYPIPAETAELTPAALAACLGEPRLALVDQTTVERWDQELLQLNHELDLTARRYLEEAGALVRQAFASGAIDRAPVAFTDRAEFQKPQPDALMTSSFGALGWRARFTLRSSDHPELARLRDEVRSLQQQRLDHVRRDIGF